MMSLIRDQRAARVEKTIPDSVKNFLHAVWAGISNRLPQRSAGVVLTAFWVGVFLHLESFAAPGDLKWKFDISMTGSSPAIGTDGTVYVRSYHGIVFALDGATGEKKWEYETGISGTITPPAIGPDGAIYVGLPNGRVDALDGRTGQRKWSYESGESAHPGVNSPAVGADGTLYVTADGQSLHVVDGRTGQRKWHRSFTRLPGCPECFFGSTPAIGAEGIIYFGTGNGSFRALDAATGEQKWEFPTESQSLTAAALGADGETLYFGSGGSALNALDRNTGQRKWQFPMGGAAPRNPAIGPDGTVYVAGTKASAGFPFVEGLFAVNGVTGQQKWEFLSQGPVYAAPAIGADGTVYLGSFRRLYALDGTTGQIKWEYLVRDRVRSSPAIGPDGTIYFVADTEGLIALETESAGGLAENSWPRDRGNNRNTGHEPFAPQVIHGVVSQVGLENRPATFSALVNSEPPPSYQWYFNNEPIPGATGPSYTIDSLSTEDEGNYLLVAGNLLGTLTNGPAMLLVANVLPTHFPGLILHGPAGAQAQVQFTHELKEVNEWNDLAEVNLEPEPSVFVDTAAVNGPQRFYRAKETTQLEISRLPGWNLTEPAGSQIQIDVVDVSSISTGWQPLTILTLPSSPHLFIDLTATNSPHRYYRTTPMP